MHLIDIEKLDYEPFVFEDSENLEMVEYISKDNLLKAPKVDPVNHAEWVRTATPMVTQVNRTMIRYNCSHCGQSDASDIIPTDLWEADYKNTYKANLSPFCRRCGYKMDLRELYEQYKRDWCEARGYALEDMDEEVGINGECYACFNEWYDNEYRESRGV